MTIEIASEYTKVATRAWVKPKKRDKTVRRREMVRKRSKSTWHKGTLAPEDVQSGDLLLRMYEETDKQLERDRIPRQCDFKDKAKRTGRGMQSNEFIAKVLRLNADLVCEDSISMKGCAAFYWIKAGRKVYTGACFRKGFMPEFTVIEVDRADLFNSDGLTYGWRTVLQRLIQQKAISYRNAMEVFGEVHHDDLRGKNWSLAVSSFR